MPEIKVLPSKYMKGEGYYMKENKINRVISLLVIACLLALPMGNVKAESVSVESVSVESAEETAGIYTGIYYYIKNVATGLYLEVNTNNNNVRASNFTGADNQKWKLGLRDSHTYVLIPKCNMTSRLTVANSSSSESANVIISSTTNKAEQLWKIPRNGSSVYTMKSGCSSYLKHLAVAGTTSGSNVVQGSGYEQKQRNWTLEKIVKGTAVHLPTQITAQVSGAIDTTGVMPAFNTYCSTMGYGVSQIVNSTATSAFSLMNEDIWVFNGHGSQAAVYFYNASGTEVGNIVASSDMLDGSTSRAVSNKANNQLAGNRCTLLMGCNAGGSSGTSNLVDTIFEKGSQFVLGPTQITYDIYDNLWIQAFFKACSEKKTVGQALSIADVASPHSNKYYYKGNTYQKLNP